MNAADWRERLAIVGHAVVPRVALDADNAALRALGAALGTASSTGITPGQPNVEQHGINRVEAMDLPRLDPAGRVILSTSADVFPLHTDDTFAASPVRYVLMHCWQPDPVGGGVSRLADVRDILAMLSASTIARLRVPDFPSPFGLAPVLFDSERGGADVCVRFNRRDFMSYGERFGAGLHSEQIKALDELLDVAGGCATEQLLAKGDCLVVDNRRVLHGRTAFDPRSGRLLKRLRTG